MWPIYFLQNILLKDQVIQTHVCDGGRKQYGYAFHNTIIVSKYYHQLADKKKF